MNTLALNPLRRAAALWWPALGLAACAVAPPVSVPEAIAPARGESLAFSVAARGVQVYECRSAAPGAAPAWQFVAPDAQLFDARGHRIGEHGAGPHWQAFDGSRLDAVVKARADAPRDGAIPWLLLSAQASGRTGSFTGVSSIQRINTQGGVAPAEGCDAASVGRIARVPYTADYRLFRGAGGSPVVF